LKILLEIGKSPRLCDVIVGCCAYSAIGTSAHLDTTNAFDGPVLEWLLRKVNRQRIKVGHELFGEWNLEGVNKLSLKSIVDNAQESQELVEAVRFLIM